MVTDGGARDAAVIVADVAGETEDRLIYVGARMMTEQVWDEPDRPQIYMFLGRPTSSAMPLMWAHSEYVKLFRSALDGKVFDFIPEVAKRDLGSRPGHQLFEVWKPNRQVRTVKPGHPLRIQMPAAFRLHWSADEWQSVKDTPSSATTPGVDFVDIRISAAQQAPIGFTFSRRPMIAGRGAPT